MKQLGSECALKSAAVVLCVCALLAGAGRGAAAAGVRYEPPGGGFSAVFPAAPEKRSEKESFGAFSLSMSGYALEHEGMAYFVIHFSLPPEAMRDPRIEDILYARMETEYGQLGTAADGNKFSIAARSDVTLGGSRGRQLVMHGPASMGVVRGYKNGQRFYLVGVFGSRGAYSAPRAVAFLESFQFTGNKK